MPVMKLTKTTIDRAIRDADSLSHDYAKELELKAIAKGRVRDPNATLPDILYFDTEVKGFGLRVTAAGKAVFIVQGRVMGTQNSVQFSVGNYGTFTVDQARDEAREHLRSMRKGIDPRIAKNAYQSAKVTLADVAAAYVGRPGKLKASSAEAINRHVATTFKAWKDKPIAAITEGMCKVRYRQMLTEGLDGKRKAQGGSPGQANQAFSVLGALLAYAGRQYRRADGSALCDRSPVSALKDDWVTLKPRTSRIPDNKVGAVWHALAQWRTETFNRETLSSIDLVSFLLLTGCRLNEAASLRFDQLHIEDDPTACWWHLPDPKNRHPFWFPLSTQAVAMLKRRQAATKSEFVFDSWSKAGHIIDPRGVMAKVSEIAGEHLSNHDMRRTMTTVTLPTRSSARSPGPSTAFAPAWTRASLVSRRTCPSPLKPRPRRRWRLRCVRT